MGMMDIFANKKKYETSGWKETERRSFTKEELAQVESAKVTMGNYGLNCCFMMHGGEKIFIPFSKASVVVEGAAIDPKELDILTLERDGKVIDRVEPK